MEGKFLESSEFDEAYAVARLTPGTNLLAMYALLGKRLGGWRGAATALTAGTIIPAVIASVVTSLLVAYAGNPLAAKAMQGARAGALAVLLWASVRLLRPQLVEHRVRGVALAVASFLAVLLVSVPQILLLLAAAGVGAAFLPRRES